MPDVGHLYSVCKQYRNRISLACSGILHICNAPWLWSHTYALELLHGNFREAYNAHPVLLLWGPFLLWLVLKSLYAYITDKDLRLRTWEKQECIFLVVLFVFLCIGIYRKRLSTSHITYITPISKPLHVGQRFCCLPYKHMVKYPHTKDQRREKKYGFSEIRTQRRITVREASGGDLFKGVGGDCSGYDADFLFDARYFHRIERGTSGGRMLVVSLWGRNGSENT